MSPRSTMLVLAAAAGLGSCAHPQPPACPAPPVRTAGSAPVAAPPPGAEVGPASGLIRVHMDVALAGGGPVIEAGRREYVSWVEAHAADPGEPPTFLIRLGEDQYWTMRPAGSFEELALQNQQLKRVDQAIVTAIGAEPIEIGTRTVHAKVASHHNELLRGNVELARAPGGDRDAVQGLGRIDELRWVVLDEVPPTDEGAYEAAITAIDQALGAQPIWRAAYWSAYGSGQRIYFLGGPDRFDLEAALRAEVGSATADQLLAAYRAARRDQVVLPAALVPMR